MALPASAQGCPCLLFVLLAFGYHLFVLILNIRVALDLNRIGFMCEAYVEMSAEYLHRFYCAICG